MNSGPNEKRGLEVGRTQFESEVLRSKEPVLVVFLAPWSHACRALQPALEGVKVELAPRARVVEMNADDCPDLSLWYGIQSIPTILYFINGVVRARIVGTASKEAILEKFDVATRFADTASSSPSFSEKPNQ
jgi:thioredoxin 1